MTDQALCRFLEWDSDSSVCGSPAPRCPGWRRTRHPRSWTVCRANAIDLLYFLADSDDPPTIRLAEDHGFRLVDLRVTLDRTLQVPAHAPQYAVRTAQPGDLPALRAMARAGFRQSRFYADPHIPAGRAGALYEIWVDKRLNDPTSRVLVVDTDGEAAGFITCLFDGADGAIDLFSVGEAARGRGIGQALVQGALAWFGEQGAQRASVVTQGRNIAALRLYQRCGFVTRPFSSGITAGSRTITLRIPDRINPARPNNGTIRSGT